MSNFLKIVKINILQTFSFTKNNTSKLKSQRGKNSLKVLGIIAIVAYIMWYIYFLTNSEGVIIIRSHGVRHGVTLVVNHHKLSCSLSLRCGSHQACTQYCLHIVCAHFLARKLTVRTALLY